MTELLPTEIPGLRMRVYSKAGVTTSTHVQLGKQFNVVMDMGQCDEGLAGSGAVFISRSTLDHVGGIFTHARLRSFMAKDQKPPKYFVPEFALDQLIRAKEAFEVRATTCVCV
jgi:ribonuclease BN (tRNA processing enzyme)